MKVRTMMFFVLSVLVSSAFAQKSITVEIPVGGSISKAFQAATSVRYADQKVTVVYFFNPRIQEWEEVPNRDLIQPGSYELVLDEVLVSTASTASQQDVAEVPVEIDPDPESILGREVNLLTLSMALSPFTGPNWKEEMREAAEKAAAKSSEQAAKSAQSKMEPAQNEAQPSASAPKIGTQGAKSSEPKMSASKPATADPPQSAVTRKAGYHTSVREMGNDRLVAELREKLRVAEDERNVAEEARREATNLRRDLEGGMRDRVTQLNKDVSSLQDRLARAGRPSSAYIVLAFALGIVATVAPLVFWVIVVGPKKDDLRATIEHLKWQVAAKDELLLRQAQEYDKAGKDKVSALAFELLLASIARLHASQAALREIKQAAACVVAFDRKIKVGNLVFEWFAAATVPNGHPNVRPEVGLYACPICGENGLVVKQNPDGVDDTSNLCRHARKHARPQPARVGTVVEKIPQQEQVVGGNRLN